MTFTKIIETKRLEPYFKIAEEKAKQSPCIRGQFASIIASEAPEIKFVTETNSRLSKCCNGGICARDRYEVEHVKQVEIGAELHSEVAALIKWGEHKSRTYFMLVGFAKGKPLYGYNCYPCHPCAMAIKFAGFKWIYIKTDQDTITPVSINQIIESRELEWETAAN